MIFELIASIGVVAGALLLRRLARRGRATGNRYVLRVRNPGEADVVLGHATGNLVTSCAVVLIDDAEHRVQIPEGIVLTIDELDAGELQPSDAGSRLMIFPNAPFWILDAPAWRACKPVDAYGTRVLPVRPYTLTTKRAFNTTPTFGTMDFPIWDGRLGVRPWALPPRSASATPIAVVMFADPHATPDRASLVGSASLVLADELTRRTDAPIVSVFPVVVGERREDLHRPMLSWDELSNLHDQLEGPHYIVRGEALRNVDDGYRVMIRLSTEAHDHVARGPLVAVVAQLVDHLHGRGAATRVEPGVALTIPGGAMTDYQRAVDHALTSLLANDANQAVRGIDGVAGTAVELSRQLAESNPTSHVLRYLWASTAIVAHEADELAEEHWNALLDLAEDPADALFEISPLLLARLDSGESANERRATLLASRATAYRNSSSPYSAWLQDLDLEQPQDSDDDA